MGTAEAISTAKLVSEYAAAFGIPGILGLGLFAWIVRNKGKHPDASADVVAAINRIERTVTDIDKRVVRVEARQDMMIGGRVTHWSEKTNPPMGDT